jgi:hypothetical protein
VDLRSRAQVISARLRSELRFDRGDGGLHVGEAVVAEQALEQALLLLRRDDLAVDQDVELPAGADLEVDGEPQFLLDPSGDPRRVGAVASGAAEEDLDRGHRLGR